MFAKLIAQNTFLCLCGNQQGKIIKITLIFKVIWDCYNVLSKAPKRSSVAHSISVYVNNVFSTVNMNMTRFSDRFFFLSGNTASKACQIL